MKEYDDGIMLKLIPIMKIMKIEDTDWLNEWVSEIHNNINTYLLLHMATAHSWDSF